MIIPYLNLCLNFKVTSDKAKVFKGISIKKRMSKKSVTRKEAIEFIKELQEKNSKHREKLDKYGFIKFPETKIEDCYGFSFKGERFYSWQEATDPYGAIKALKILFKITEGELK